MGKRKDYYWTTNGLLKEEWTTNGMEEWTKNWKPNTTQREKWKKRRPNIISPFFAACWDFISCYSKHLLSKSGE